MNRSVLVLVVLLLLALHGGVAPAVAQGADVACAASGRVEPVGEERALAFTVPGTLAKIAVVEGASVTAGQVLAELDAAEERSALASAEAELNRASATLERVKAGERAEARRAASAAVARARAELDAALHVRQRVAALHGAEVPAASDEELERADDAVAVARAALAQAAAARELADAGPRAEDVAVAQAGVASARSAVEVARARLSKTKLASPVAGTVLSVHRREGEAVGPGSDVPVLVVGDTGKLLVRAEVDESDLAKVRAGQRVELRAAALGEARVAGSVTRLGDRMGRKRLYSDDPREKADTRVLEVMVTPSAPLKAPVGLRVDVYFMK